MKISRKILILSLILLIFCLTSVSAAEVQNNTIDSNLIDETDDFSDTLKTDDNSNSYNILSKNNDNNQIKKEAYNTVNITSDNYQDYFKNNRGTLTPTDNIQEGNIINLQGTFNDLNFNLDKSNIIFTSIGKNAILNNCTVYVQGQTNTIISNLTIVNTKNDCEGITVDTVVNISITDNNILVSGTNGFAFTSYDMKQSTVKNNILESKHTQTTMRIYGSNDNLFMNNSVMGYANGIYLCAYDEDVSNNNIIINNTVIGKKDSPICYTIQLMGSGNIVENNTVSGGYRGISSEDSNIIRNNDVDATFIGIFTSKNSTIENNYIHVSKNSSGIAVSGSESLIKNNLILCNETGIDIGNNNIQIINNTIISNKYGIYSQGFPTYKEINITKNDIIGQIYNTGNMTVDNNTLHRNNMEESVINNTGTIVLTNNIIKENNITKYGIINTKNGTITSKNNIFENNTPPYIELINEKLTIIDENHFIPVNASISIYEKGSIIQETQMINSIIDYSLPSGNHELSIVISNENSSFKNNSFKFTYNNPNGTSVKQNPTLTINNIGSVPLGTDITISGTFKNPSGKALTNTTLKININGISSTVKTDKNGTYTLPIVADTIGNNNITVSYAGNSKYNPTTITTNFTVTQSTTKLNPTISINDIEPVTLGTDIKISGTLKNPNGNALTNVNIKININGITTSVKTDKKGTYSLAVVADTAGTNNVTVNYAGNSKYNPAKATTTYTVTQDTSKQNPILTVDSIENVKLGDTIIIHGTFKNPSGKALTSANLKISVNGIKTAVKTDKNGTYSLTITANTTGDNNIVVIYTGNSKYNPTRASTSFTIKQDTQITINPISNVKLNEKVTITGTLKNDQNKALSSANIKVKLNGVTTTVKTDKNGAYTLTTTNTIQGINNITVTYAGNNKFNKSTTTTTFTCK